MSQVTLYLDDLAQALVDRGAAREGKSKSRFVIDLVKRVEGGAQTKVSLDEMWGALADASGPEPEPDWAAIRRASNAGLARNARERAARP